MFGFFNIRKPAGPTSHDLVAQLRRKLPRKTKVGHAGTLDPFAEGVLVLCAGPATRLASYVQQQPKRYRARITLGATSTTDDSQGEIRSSPFHSAPDEKRIREVISTFLGDVWQIPPAHSAVHIHGQRAYKLARAGEEITLAARTVHIYEIELISCCYPHLEIDVACGSGTYLRSLARDIGAALGVGGYCSELTRTAIGKFRLEEARNLETLDLENHLIPPLAALDHLPKVTIPAEWRERLSHGNPLPLPADLFGSEAALIDPAENLLALAEIDTQAGLLRPARVFIAG